MKLLFATGNENKYNLMKRRLSCFDDIEVIMPKHINLNINIVEDGKTAEENAIKKAKAYHNQTNMNVIAEDSGLYIEKFSEEDQPGLFVRRINGREDLSDNEILQHYLKKLNEVGGESLAHYKTGVAIVDDRGNVYSITIDEEPFLLTSKSNKKESLKGGTLDCISYDIKCQKYFNELTSFEKEKRYKKIDEKTIELINNIKESNFINKMK